ncbi:MAG: type II toxin-antitoxin system HicA family toxin [Anaerolineales bacterium]|nr:type II toxin-antitoxin system HicA family toxin [Anaerolineales bacterium]
MPKFPSLTPQKVIKILERKGFVLDRSKGSHRIYIHPVTGKKAVVPFHRKDLPLGTLRDIFKQAGIEPEELQD